MVLKHLQEFIGGTPKSTFTLEENTAVVIGMKQNWHKKTTPRNKTKQKQRKKATFWV